ncbi:MAG: nucleotide exchange factor GrpE [Salinarimonas sp.]|nr:nucleotide exchange factor GrpE [Salinarimonas sp.]
MTDNAKPETAKPETAKPETYPKQDSHPRASEAHTASPEAGATQSENVAGFGGPAGAAFASQAYAAAARDGAAGHDPQDEAAPGAPGADAVAAAEAEKAEMKDRLLRTLADMENLRRRTEKEVADARAYAVTAFARDMLTVADNIHRALDAVPDEARAAMNDALKGLIEGIELTERDLMKSLERHGVRKLAPEGEKFDPNLHQAMFEVPNPEVPSGQVVQVVQDGYVIGERVLRPAMVGVAKGGPKGAPKAGSNGGSDSAA